MLTILCPTDFSPRSEHAVRYADDLAQHINSHVVLLHVIPEPADVTHTASPNTSVPEVLQVLEVKPSRDPVIYQLQKSKLDTLKERLEKVEWGMPVSYTTIVQYGHVKDTVTEAAHKVGADMLVISGDAKHLQEQRDESLTAALLKNSPCPILLVPPQAKFRPVEKIVFATDLLDAPYPGNKLISGLARVFDAEIMLLHVVVEALPYRRQLAQEELERLHHSFPFNKTTYHTETSALLEEGISQFCRRRHANLLVMGYHPQHSRHHMFSQLYNMERTYHMHLPLLVLPYKY